MTARRLVVKDVTGQIIGVPHDQVNLTGVENVNPMDPPVAVVQQRCDLGCWHDVSSVTLPCWGRA